MRDRLIRVRVFADDHELEHILRIYRNVQEDARRRAVRVRRGAEGEFLRRLLVAGYQALYGNFPVRPSLPGGELNEPGSAAKAPARARRNGGRGHHGHDMNAQDIKTIVASSNNSGHDDTDELSSGPASTKTPFDFSQLLGAGASN